ncbi:MAG: hypothetical protein EOO24_03275 [Comamonadaceae bacterium]|nr:MAG: hypothetical protein EOO24_03275 [Comamonadaceae bacterium]
MTDFNPAPSSGEDDDPNAAIQEPRLWRDGLWTARVIKNEDDDGWAVSMTRQGESEPALVGPWTMGRDKKNPKPLDAPAFHTLVKTAAEVLRRHEQQLHAQLNRHVHVGSGSQRIRVSLRIVPDEDNPHAILSAHDESGNELGEARVAPGYKLTGERAEAWIEGGFGKPG